MSTEGVDKSKRRFLIAATTAVGGVGTAFVAYPFLAYWQPSARAQAAGAPVEVDISKIEPGQRITVEWRGKPVWVVRRTSQNLQDLATLGDQLRDPDSNASVQPEYAKNPARTIVNKEQYLVVVGVCTHLGCSPLHVREEDAATYSLGSDWKGGFFCPCHGSRFDLAGRVYKDVPAPSNLDVPPYSYVTDTVIMVGVDKPKEGAV